MKFIISILATSIMLLSVQPYMNQTLNSFSKTSVSKNCCSKHKTEKKSHQNKKCCDKGVCNPFGICSCCLYIFQQTESGFTFSSFNKQKYVIAEIKFLNNYINDTFHPPNNSA